MVRLLGYVGIAGIIAVAVTLVIAQFDRDLGRFVGFFVGLVLGAVAATLALEREFEY